MFVSSTADVCFKCSVGEMCGQSPSERPEVEQGSWGVIKLERCGTLSCFLSGDSSGTHSALVLTEGGSPMTLQTLMMIALGALGLWRDAGIVSCSGPSAGHTEQPTCEMYLV